ncbi:MAG TPA: hypothetical protein VKX45_16105 [Bryobacteraceae bacterium]|jgi:hypothetical protein|nr:hypothetical protein [Bryobacteraceae bacterium]
MKRLYMLIFAAAVGCTPAMAAVFVFPRVDCVVNDQNHWGNYPLWQKVLDSSGGDPAAGESSPSLAYFGYTSFQSSNVTIAQGSNNLFVQDPQFRNQPAVYNPGTHYYVFGTTFDPSIGLSWFLNGSFATATTMLPPCPGMSINGTPLAAQFAPVGVANGQTVRLKANCTGTFSFADSAGNVIASNAGAATGQRYFDLVGSTVATPGHRTLVQPRFSGGCQTSVEVFATATGVTAAAAPPIQPYYQYAFDPQGLSAGQTLRINLAASPAQACGAHIAFQDISGNPIGPSLDTGAAGLAAGTATHLDLPSTYVPGLSGWSGGHVLIWPVLYPEVTTGSVIANNNSYTTFGKVANNVLVDETCFASVEIFDTLTGNTRSVMNPQPIN